MADPEQIEQVIKMLDDARPTDFFKKMDETKLGIGAVIKLLHKNDGRATAGQISESLGISTARVAVLIRKMAAKGLVEKQTDANDARVTVVCMTEQGWQFANEMKEKMYRNVEAVIEKIGIEKLMEFIELSKIIKSVCKPPDEM